MTDKEYEKWIERERKVRSRILLQSPTISKAKIIMVCLDCRELLLCHETDCPNCNSKKIVNEKIDSKEFEGAVRDSIRCRYRYRMIKGKTKESII